MKIIVGKEKALLRGTMSNLLHTNCVVKPKNVSIDFSYIRHSIGSLKCRQFVFAGNSPRSTLIRHSHIVRVPNTEKINAVPVRNLKKSVACNHRTEI